MFAWTSPTTVDNPLHLRRVYQGLSSLRRRGLGSPDCCAMAAVPGERIRRAECVAVIKSNG